jgi:hypothetical protein
MDVNSDNNMDINSDNNVDIVNSAAEDTVFDFLHDDYHIDHLGRPLPPGQFQDHRETHLAGIPLTDFGE